ncbi:VOC family protein [Bacillus alkalicellulosilyticus]|uniref:VOC family protein n=1 Tax=Alkalihalobacterium alkalicellulosilyticum TaxID=1912214 RepID=UPI0009977C57|nr:VOC family protein [Bacillus alkalicellulosilyticus]
MKFHKPPLTYVSHAHLFVEDITRSLSFYQDVLGFKVFQNKEKQVHLSLDGQTKLLTIEQPVKVQRKEPRRSGLYHIALLLPSRKELANVLKYLISIGYDSMQGYSDHLVSEAIYLADPDGNGIELYCDRPSEQWEWTNNEVNMSSIPLDVPNLLKESDAKGFAGLHADTIFGHIHLHVADLQKAKEFYVEALGFNVVHQLGNHALFLSHGGYHHHVAINVWNGVGAPAPSLNSVGLQYFTLTIESEEEKTQILQSCFKLGYSVEENLISDPSGNQIQLRVY